MSNTFAGNAKSFDEQIEQTQRLEDEALKLFEAAVPLIKGRKTTFSKVNKNREPFYQALKTGKLTSIMPFATVVTPRI